MAAFGYGRHFRPRRATVLLLALLVVLWIASGPARAQAPDPSPPAEPVKLIFIHHSCGENWLADGHGDLGRTLARNNYFVSDTNYGWGPDSIGDRTDIVDWPEWFTGSGSSRYLAALFRESAQNSPYTRTMGDPGGENRIVMFKSCFPNSNLEGRPNDPPRRGEGLTVANAKAIYNELLAFFATRPDKLFVAVTAPPVQDRTHAANARAFNNWLVQDWLAGYPGVNVAVIDFYNVLTGPDNHHRFRRGRVEHVAGRGRNTLYYPSNGDDHPSPRGNRKATEELVPLLSIAWNRFRQSPEASAQPLPRPAPVAAVPGAPPPAPGPPSAPEPPSPDEAPAPPAPPAVPQAMVGNTIDDFETDSDRWVVFSGQAPGTHLSCVRDPALAAGGTGSLRIEYRIPAESWATCSLVYPGPMDWSDRSGLSLAVHAEKAGVPLTIIAYQGATSDSLLHFEIQIQTDQQAVTGWQRLTIPWDQLVEPPWQGDGRFDPRQAIGVAFSAPAPNEGRVWVDDVKLLGGGASGQ